MTIGKTRRRLGVESLESRHLLAVTFQSFTVALSDSQGFLANVSSITNGPDGNIWFTGTGVYSSPPAPGGGATLGSINPATHISARYPISGLISSPGPIVSAPDGNLYYAGTYYDVPIVRGGNGDVGSIVGISPTTHTTTEQHGTRIIAGETIGPDGNVWFTENVDGFPASSIGVLNLTTRVVTEYPLPNTRANPIGITAADGLLWFTEPGSKMIASIDPTTHAITEYPISQDITPNQIILGPDGNLWFSGIYSSTSTSPPLIGEFNLTTHAVSTFSAPAYYGLTTGPDGNIWFTGRTTIGSINPITDVVTSYNSPYPLTQPSSLYGSAIVTGPDNNLYFTGPNAIIEARVLPQPVVPTGSLSGNVTILPTIGSSNAGGPFVNQTVFVDLNNTGTYYVGEPSATTDASGNYTITGLVPGTYTVRVAPFPNTFATVTAGGQSVTVVANQTAALPTFTIAPTTSILPIMVIPLPFGSKNPDVETAEAVGLYQTILGRMPDPAGEAAAVIALKEGTPVAQIAASLLNSPEYFADTAIVDYRSILGRAPTPADIAAVVSTLQGGYPPDLVARNLYTSDEFTATHADNASFVAAVYQDVLGRPASAGEVSALSAALLDPNELTRASLVGSLQTSMERFIDTVDALYAAFLSRTPEPDGFIAGMNALSNATPISYLALGLINSPEFAIRAKATVG